MPCYDERSSPEYVSREYLLKIDKLTQMLCRTFTYLEKCGQDQLIQPEDRAWWASHKEFDRKRRARQREELLQRRERLQRELRDIDKRIK